MAAIRLLLRDKTLAIRVATNTKIAETLMFAKFKYDQSMDIFWLRFIIVEEGALQLVWWLQEALQVMSEPMMGLSWLAAIPDKL